MNVKTVAERIRLIISQSPDCRHDKRKLVANYLHSEMKDLGLNKDHVSYFDFLKMYASGKFTEIETITRLLREVVRELDQAEGKVHDLKQDEQEKVKQDVKSI